MEATTTAQKHTVAAMDTTVEVRRVAGVDGCRTGWVVASLDGCRVVERLDDSAGDFDVIGVDMPIGLPVTGPRRCDVDARKFLTPRGSTVFPAPPRAIVHHTDYSAANASSRATFGRGLSRQSFGLFPKIREVDALARRRPDDFVEIHPECAFSRMAGHVLESKHTPQGQSARAALVEAHFGPIDRRLRGAAADDVLDAYAVLWSALRFDRREHVVFGDNERDDLGLVMRIVS